jgi:molybdate transport system regulatory protein
VTPLKSHARLELSLALPNGGRLEPVDVRLIETIRASRSISGAGRALGISYRKTWCMVDALNRTFSSRVVETYPGRHEGGAEVTAFGERLVALYRSIERRSASSTAAAMAEIVASLDPDFVVEPAGEAGPAAAS